MKDTQRSHEFSKLNEAILVNVKEIKHLKIRNQLNKEVGDKYNRKKSSWKKLGRTLNLPKINCHWPMLYSH